MAHKVLIVYAHQSCRSFNAAAKNEAVTVLQAHNCEVKVSDLYAMKFKATATAEDITEAIEDTEHFCYAEATKLARAQKTLSKDITDEQEKLDWADLVIFQFPMYWFSVPAIMKGWIDRVLTLDYAYSPEKRYSQGPFNVKKALLSFTTGSNQPMFSANGINGDMNVTLWPLQNGILHYCGFQVLAPQIFWAPRCATKEEREVMLKEWGTRLEGLMGEEPLSFAPPDSFDKDFKLKPEVQDKHADQEYGLTVGTHLNKRLPPNQMRAGV